MKNFYDLLDINKNIDFVLEVEPILKNGEPIIKVLLNQDCIFGKYSLTAYQKICTRISLLDTIKLEVIMSDKKYNANLETAIIIKKLEIDGIEVIPKYNHLIDYQNDHNINTKTNYLGYNGTWTLDIDRPFYQWLHQASGQGWLLEP